MEKIIMLKLTPWVFEEPVTVVPTTARPPRNPYDDFDAFAEGVAIAAEATVMAPLRERARLDAESSSPGWRDEDEDSYLMDLMTTRLWSVVGAVGWAVPMGEDPDEDCRVIAEAASARLWVEPERSHGLLSE